MNDTLVVGLDNPAAAGSGLGDEPGAGSDVADEVDDGYTDYGDHADYGDSDEFDDDDCTMGEGGGQWPPPV